jgi:hypothetical protein
VPLDRLRDLRKSVRSRFRRHIEDCAKQAIYTGGLLSSRYGFEAGQIVDVDGNTRLTFPKKREYAAIRNKEDYRGPKLNEVSRRESISIIGAMMQQGINAFHDAVDVALVARAADSNLFGLVRQLRGHMQSDHENGNLR